MTENELKKWERYAETLKSLPQPALPLGLMERTRARILEQREAAAERKREAWKFAVLVVFGWASSFVTWSALRMLAGGSFTVLGANLLDGFTWMAVSTVFVWMTAASAAVVLGKQPQLERTL
jgi:hypothetical protein